MSNKPFRVALVQHPPVFLNLAATTERAERLVRECAAEGAEVIVFPETWLPGYPVWVDGAPGAALWGNPAAKALFRLLRENAPEVPGPEIERIRRAAADTRTVVVVGVHEKRGGTLYNTTVTIDGDSGETAVHRKLVPTYTERMMWGAGDGSTLQAVRTRHGVVGALVCWEHWMPFARAVMHAQHEVLHVAQWPGVHELHQVCSRQYAFEGQCYVAASGCSMTQAQMLEGFDSLASGEQGARDLLDSISDDPGSYRLSGGSALIAPDISYVAGPLVRDPGVLYGEVNPQLIDEARLTIDTDGHYSRPDVFELRVDTRARANVRLEGATE